jgi:FixJ family two-component response regulator
MVMATPQETIIIAEEDLALIESLEALLVPHDFKVLRFSDSQSLIKAGRQQVDGSPSVLILGDIAGVELLGELKNNGWEIPVIFLHSGGSINAAVKAIRAGADDYVAKPFCPETLLLSVKHSMEKARSRVEFTKINQVLLKKAATLTQREQDIINMVLAGMLNKQIAERLGLALVTVKVHRGSAMRKLGARTAGELARIAKEAGIPSQHNSPPPPSSPTDSGQQSASLDSPG